MALDGIVVASLVAELDRACKDGRIAKIAQPEKDALLFTIKKDRENRRLFLSAGAGLPLVYLTDANKPSPITAPAFCMLLRKHLGGARILSVRQVGLERVIQIECEHLNEMGDLCKKYLIVELMGKHSNLIFCNEDFVIIDSIKRVSGLVSSVREVLPGKDYFIPNTMDKLDPCHLEQDSFVSATKAKPMSIQKAIYTTLTGFSPLMANEICHRAQVDPDAHPSALSKEEFERLCQTITQLMDGIERESFQPNIVYEGSKPIEFSCFPLEVYQTKKSKEFPSISKVLEEFYSQKEVLSRIRQKSVDLRKIVSNALERNRKKFDLQEKQLRDTEKRDKFKVYGELLTTYGYEAKVGDKFLTCLNYYTNEDIKIPLDDTMTAIENAKKYFERYNKLKRTFEALTIQCKETREEILHLESISNALDIALTESDLTQIKEELMEFGHMRKRTFPQKQKGKAKPKRSQEKSKPFHYISSDGFHIYVGRNNYQNEEITFEMAAEHDWWFHAKGLAGSHVIVKANGEELPDRTFEEAGRLAGYYSKARGGDKVEIDYTEKKNVKKPKGGKPGFVVYYTNYSLVMPATIDGIKEIDP